ncbi:MAG: hypothetical protein KatS3mg008_2175 [Acidimicrobiales bacterium]|nr:MAG: hypothetical protein KatS3mg008_2175 [Acidimicrobiales bacterium]
MDLVPLEEAKGEIRARCRPLPEVRVQTTQSLGCVLAEEVRARLNVPRFDNSAMDGYALRVSGRLGVGDAFRTTGCILAGAGAEEVVADGEAVRIMTGAPVPPGANTVIPMERVRVDGDRVEVLEPVALGANVRKAGEDVRAGEPLAEVGERVNSRLVALLMAAGVEEVVVRRPPVVGVVSGGDELAASSADLRGPSQIVDSNRPLICALLTEAGFSTRDLGIVPDDESAMVRVLRRGAESCDAIVTTGGVSVGDRDLVPRVLAELGDAWSYRLAIKPGKPFAFGLVDGTPVFALAGNPVSALVAFELIVLPMLGSMMGLADPEPPRVVAVSEERLPGSEDGRTHYVRCAVDVDGDGVLRVRPAGGQGSHQLKPAAWGNVLAVVNRPEGVEAGEKVEVMPLTGAPWPQSGLRKGEGAPRPG